MTAWPKNIRRPLASYLPTSAQVWLGRAQDWCMQLWFAHHNARVLADMEYRFGCVLNHTTRGMSKAYYTWEAMQAEIDEFHNEMCNDAYREGEHDKAEDLEAAHDVRVTELLEANNRLLERARKAEARANENRSTPITRHDDGTYTVHDMGQ